MIDSQHWKKIQSTNRLERLNREVKRRADVVQVFPNDAAIERLATAVLIELHDEWIAFPRRYLSNESTDASTRTRPPCCPPPTNDRQYHDRGHDQQECPVRVCTGRPERRAGPARAGVTRARDA